MIGRANEAFYPDGIEDIFEYLSRVALGVPMIYINQSYSSVCILKLMILAICRDIDIRSLRYRLRDKFRSTAAT